MTQVEDTAPQTPPSDGVASRLRDAHLGSLLAGVSVVFIVLKVLAVAHFEITTALAIVVESGTASLLVGAMVRTLGAVLMAALVILIVVALDERTPEADRRLYRGLGWAVGIIAAVLQPAVLAVGVLALSWMAFGGPGRERFFLAAKARARRKRDEKYDQKMAVLKAKATAVEEAAEALRRRSAETAAETEALAETAKHLDDLNFEEMTALTERSIANVMDSAVHTAELSAKALEMLDYSDKLRESTTSEYERLEAARPKARRQARWFVLFFVFWAVAPIGSGLLTDRPWLPAERIAPKGRPAITGFVLKAEDNEMVILQDQPRRIVRLAEAPASREYCWIEKNSSRINWWVGALLRSPAEYPLCESLHP